MAFEVEDGTGLANANAFISVEFFDSYHEDRGHTAAAGISDEDKETCIVRATDYINKRFGRKMRGSRRGSSQALCVPRLGMYDDDGLNFPEATSGIPLALAQATAEYALRAAVYSELAPDPVLIVPTQDFTGADLPAVPDGPAGPVTSTSEKVDVIEESVSYARPRPSALDGSTGIPEYPAADMLIQELIKSTQDRNVYRA